MYDDKNNLFNKGVLQLVTAMTIQQHFENTELWNTIGFEFLKGEEGSAEIALNFSPDLTNVAGTLHGGIMMTMLDNTMGIAAYTLGFDLVMTIQMETRFVRPVLEGRLIASAKTIDRTKSTAIIEGRIYDEQQQLIAMCTSTFKGVHHA